MIPARQEVRSNISPQAVCDRELQAGDGKAPVAKAAGACNFTSERRKTAVRRIARLLYLTIGVLILTHVGPAEGKSRIELLLNEAKIPFASSKDVYIVSLGDARDTVIVFLQETEVRMFEEPETRSKLIDVFVRVFKYPENYKPSCDFFVTLNQLNELFRVGFLTASEGGVRYQRIIRLESATAKDLKAELLLAQVMVPHYRKKLAAMRPAQD
jgi:hypothetical protein